MTETHSGAGEFDIQPSPRILPMLGEITLPQWRCLAELIDNAIDAFLKASRAGQAVSNPEVQISIPAQDTAGARIVVRDNATGMSPEALENAVRAGWTGNDPMNSLGLFGMGFNIATARLGSVTRVFTTRSGDREWCGLEIDFDALRRQRHFRTPRLSRPKADASQQGTEIILERLKPEQRAWFSKAPNKTKLVRDFGLTYSAMLRSNGLPLSFQLQLNNTVVRPRLHCIWGGLGNVERIVSTSDYGDIDAYQAIDVPLPERRFCTECWQWLGDEDATCPACNLADAVVTRERRVKGWLGVQRYVSESEYGIDFLRNGRKIEVANKDLFTWESGGASELEYPVDDPRHRGRIVGEIHLDHCRPTYMKDRFDRNDPAWDEMVAIVRGEGPLRPRKRQELGLGPSATPLFRLYQAFRRHQPHVRQGLGYEKLLAVKDNDRAAEMAKRFHAGELEYQADDRWWALTQESDRELLVQRSGSAPPTPSPFGDDTAVPDQPQGTVTPPNATDQRLRPAVAPAARVSIASLTTEYTDQITSQRWDVHAFRARQNDVALHPSTAPWSLTATPAGVWDFIVNPDHQVFRSATMTPLDALLSELAWSASDYARVSGNHVSFGVVLASLRDRYGIASRLDPLDLASDATELLARMGRSLGGVVNSEDSQALFEELAPSDKEAVIHRMAARAVPNPQRLIQEGRFLEYSPRATLIRFFEAHPELFLDGRCWNVPFGFLDYGDLAATQSAQRATVRYYSGLLADAAWLADSDSTDLSAASRTRLLRAALSLELLAAEQVAATSD